ncbi:flagellar motor switch protein FliY [Sulfurospirillum diekertiae]|uniref:Flagellar motor switch protein FliN n=1 Tax=Sulfurospirillum diekertiae TaxID=1854492 RepID=A0A290HAH7_9BACT|nr:flagellar motor switch protein FliY [Sulfurospirillum diekertiae]ATB68477.1 putative flagellar motor switch phosphatase FliY [Sulfurospirillum diekertiae]QIR76332.1 flagellar motor switch protein FliY [Sulfurospirillum diekertiae]QIR78962.1 flagellar motor switch protein FliY [Sulfurospirillum diekertiae]
MNTFVQLLQQEVVSTIEGLTGIAPTVELNAEESGESKLTLSPPLAKLDITVGGELHGKMRVTMATSIATAIGDMMLGGEGNEKEDMDAEDLDATKEIISNILSSFSRSLGSQKNMPKLEFEIENVEYIDPNSTIDFKGFEKLFIYNLAVHNSHDTIAFAITHELTPLIGEEVSAPSASSAAAQEFIFEEPKKVVTNMSPEELSNIELIKDVRLPIRVRIGSKKMLLKDVLSMDIGSVIELDQLANDPLEILVGDKVIAMGEVVIVDGNFGVQIGEIGTKRERLEKLR